MNYKGYRMKEYYLLCDESGAKGYSDSMESSVDKVGVMAGYLVPDNQIVTIRKELNKIRNNYFTGGKVHISDLSPDEQVSLRCEIFKYIKINCLYCVYEAISVEGFISFYKDLNQRFEQIKGENISPTKTPDIKFKECLHFLLFQGIFADVSACLYDNAGDKFILTVISDNIDKGVLKQFEKKADELLSFDKSIKDTWKRFNHDSKQIEEYTLSFTVDDLDNFLVDLSGIKFSIKKEDSGLTLAADVLANSINHHLSTRYNEIIETGLKTIDAMKGYYLNENIYGLSDSDEIPSYSDILYNKKV